MRPFKLQDGTLNEQGEKMRNLCLNILSGDDSGSVTGGKIDANQLVSASFLGYFGDNTAAGTLKIQFSNDPTVSGNLAADFTPVNWADIPNASAAVSSGASVAILIANMSFRWIRAVYTRSGGGSTTVQCNMNALGI